MNIKIGSALSAIFLLATSSAFATAYSIPATNEVLIGNIQYSSAEEGDNVVKVAKRYDIGYNAMLNANPQLDLARSFPAGAPMVLPTQHMLPNNMRDGIVVNLPEMRMYYFPRGSSEVLTYPIGIGKIGKTIPIMNTVVTRKAKNPVWIPPQDIREFNLEQGIVLPKVMPAGPDNPLGPYAIYMKLPTYLIHSTIFPESVGKRASFGCLRMYEGDIETFFPSVEHGVPVSIINQPNKIGWQRDQLYLEAHEPLEEHQTAYDATLPGMVHAITMQTQNQSTLVDWQLVSYIAQERDGVPHAIGQVLK